MYCISCDLHSKRMQRCVVEHGPAYEGYPLPDAEDVSSWSAKATAR